MTMIASSGESRAVGVNPYSPTAVARVSEVGQGLPTVSTRAVEEAFRYLDAFLAQAVPPERVGLSGRLLTVVGEYGTGKSHLAAALLHRARRSGDSAVRTLYVEAPQFGSLIDLYKRFVGRLDREDIVDLLRDYYSEVVADGLSHVPHAQQIADDLRRHVIEPQAVVDDLGLPESVLLPQLQDRLIEATGDDDLGTAMTLLLDERTAVQAWDWLIGNRSDGFVTEHGLSKYIDSSAAAMSAIIALLNLHGRSGRRFVVVLDELDRVLDPADQRDAGVVGQFRNLLTAVEESGAFLIITGLVEITPQLQGDVLQRMGHAVRMTPLTGQEARELIEQSHLAARGDSDIAPFLDDAVQYLVDMTHGVPRQLIKLCHHLYRRAELERTVIGIELVQLVARDHFDFATIDDVRREVMLTLEREAIGFERRRQLDVDGRSLLDLVVLNEDGEPSCVILLSEGIMRESDVERVARRAAAARAEGVDVEIILVVVGYLAPDVASNVRNVVLAEPIEYERRTFASAVVARIDHVLQRDRLSETDPVRLMVTRVDRLVRQQAGAYTMIDRLEQQVRDMRRTTNQRLSEISADVAGLLTGAVSVSRAVPVPTQPGPMDEMGEIDELFESAIDAAVRLGDGLPDAFTQAFRTAPGLSTAIRSAQERIHGWTADPDSFSLLGTAVFLQSLIESFRQAVVEWRMRRVSVDRADAASSSSDLERLDVLCLTYEAIFDYASLQHLKRLAESMALPPEAAAATGPHPMHLDDIREVFGGLGARVRAAARRTIGDV